MRYSKICSLLFVYFTLFPANLCPKPILTEAIVEQEAIHAIKDFYTSYASNIISEIASNDLLVQRFLTKRLIEKVDRMRAATGADPIIRAQDFREDVIETLQVKHLAGNWYMVSYDWVEDKKVDNVSIPLRIVKTDGGYRIDYITPEWNASLYGDSLLCDHLEPQEIDTSTPLIFFKNFL
ncbi:MAG: YbjP/YqhG family protein [Prevotellaceae bacterium]|jgi:hypothetical protein|nr:YbjP/YqhG family protein [Prevotellaceae bacterium]